MNSDYLFCPPEEKDPFRKALFSCLNALMKFNYFSTVTVATSVHQQCAKKKNLSQNLYLNNLAFHDEISPLENSIFCIFKQQFPFPTFLQLLHPITVSFISDSQKLKLKLSTFKMELFHLNNSKLHLGCAWKSFHQYNL